jgi:hypothetical protein
LFRQDRRRNQFLFGKRVVTVDSKEETLTVDFKRSDAGWVGIQTPHESDIDGARGERPDLRNGFHSVNAN